MKILHKDEVPDADHMIRALLVVVGVAITKDTFTGELGLFWNFMLPAVIVALFIVKVMPYLRR